MRTDDLIDRLALDAGAVRVRAAVRDLLPAAAIGGLGALALVLAVYGVQPGLALAPAAEAFAMKLAYGVALAAVALAVLLAAARPGGSPPSWRWLAVPAFALGIVAVIVLAAAPAGARPGLLLGGSWTRCPFRILALSLPVAAALVIAMRRHAPTDLRRAGAAVGLLSGAVAASVYALACTETSPAFVLLWYSVGMALSAFAGRLAGPRLLRW